MFFKLYNGSVKFFFFKNCVNKKKIISQNFGSIWLNRRSLEMMIGDGWLNNWKHSDLFLPPELSCKLSFQKTKEIFLTLQWLLSFNWQLHWIFTILEETFLCLSFRSCDNPQGCSGSIATTATFRFVLFNVILFRNWLSKNCLKFSYLLYVGFRTINIALFIFL